MKKFLLILFSIPVAVFVFVTVALMIVHKAKGIEFSYENNGTDLMFSSSDGGWAEEEDMINGKHYESILESFNEYKNNCGNRDIKLVRTKDKKKPWKWAWWFDNYRSPKWKVQFVTENELKTLISNSSSCLAADA